MNDYRKLKLFDELVAWVYDHCSDMDAYVRALWKIGFTAEEAFEDLITYSGLSEAEVLATIRDVWPNEEAAHELIERRIA